MTKGVTLQEVMAEWIPKKSEVLGVMRTDDDTKITVTKNIDKTYSLFRFFRLASKWVCSVDVETEPIADNIIKKILEY